MVRGLETFRGYFEGLEACYVLIGGTACDLWMSDSGLSFRATKDLDIVLVVDALDAEFFRRFWNFVRDAGYQSMQSSGRTSVFYRFTGTDNHDYPFMIELLSRNLLDLPDSMHLTPIPAGEDISSLSAILLDDDYYNYVVASRIEIDGIPTIPAECIIPLKARAHLDLLARRDAGDQGVKGFDIKKHRNDVFRLYLTLAPDDRFDLPPLLAGDLADFVDRYPSDHPDWPGIRQAVGRSSLPAADEVLSQLRAIFRL